MDNELPTVLQCTTVCVYYILFAISFVSTGSTDAIAFCTTGNNDPITSALHIILGL